MRNDARHFSARSKLSCAWLIPVLLVALPGGRAPLAAGGGPPRAIASPARAPQPFEENRGQAGAMEGFVSRGAGYAARLDADGINLVLPGADATAAPGRLRIDFLAARSTEPPAGIERLNGVVHYLAGDDATRWITGIPTFAGVRYDALYDGIDLTVRGDHRRLALDFAIGAGADARVIALDLEARDARVIDPAGADAFLLGIGAARLRFTPPAGTTLEFDGHRLRLEGAGALTRSDQVLHLTIERVDAPPPAADARVAVGPRGDVFLAGRAPALAFEPDGTPAPGATAELFVSRRDRDTITPRYTAYLGGDADDLPLALSVGADDEVVLSGATQSTDFPSANTTLDTATARGATARPEGGALGFVARLGADGDRLAGATRFGAIPAAPSDTRNLQDRIAAARGTSGRDRAEARGARNGADATGAITDLVFDPEGRPMVAGFDATGGWRPGRLVQPAPAGGLLYAGPLGDAAPGPEAAGCPGTIQFDNTAGTGLWQTATNWDLDRLPTSTDDVCIPTGFAVTLGAGALPVNTLFVTSGASLSVASGGTLTIAAASQVAGSLTVTGGTITGAGTLDVNTSLVWSGGVITGAGTVNANGGMSVSGAVVKDLTAARVLNTAGTVTWTGTGTMRVGGGAVIHNTGTWDAQSNAGFSTLAGTGMLFDNQAGATFKKTVLAGITTIAIQCDNAGTLDAQAGTISLTAGGSGTGGFQGSNGATLRFGGGTYTLGALSTVAVPIVSVTAGLADVSGSFSAGATSVTGGELRLNPAATLAGLGSITQSGGTISLDSGEAVALTSITLSAGTLQGGDTVSVSGTIDWSGGTMAGAGTINANGGLAMSGAATKDINGARVLNVVGASTWAGTGSLRTGNGATIHNSGTWTAQSDATITVTFGGTALFDNQSGAIFRKGSGAGITSLAIPFDNHGTIDIVTGTVSLSAGGTGSGPITGATGTTLRFAGGAYLLGAGASVNVPAVSITGGSLDVSCPYSAATSTSISIGTATFNPAATLTSLGSDVTVTGGTLSLDSGEAIALNTLTQSAGTLQGGDTITLSGPYSWSGGSLTGAATMNANGALAVSGAATKDLTQSRVLNIAGASTWSGPGSIRMGTGAAIHNAGTWTAQGDASLTNTFGGTVLFDNHAGATFRKNAGTGITTIDVPFDNLGTVDVQTGTLATSAGGTGSGSFGGAAGSTLSFTGGAYTLTAASSMTVPNVSIAGTASLQVNGTFTPATATSMTGGSATFNPSATLTTLGTTLTLGGGTLTLNSGEIVTVGSLAISAGVRAGLDQLNVTGGATWSGGGMSGAGTTVLMGGMALSGATIKDLTAGHQLVTPAGTVSWMGTGNIRMSTDATIHNEGANWMAQSDAGFTNLGAAGSFINHEAGAFRKTAGTGTTPFAVTFDNDGVCEVQTGTIELAGGGVAGGSFSGSPGGTLRFNGGAYTLANTSTVAVPTVAVNAGTLDVHGSFAAGTATSVTGGAMTFYPDATATALGGALSIGPGTLTLDSGEPIDVATLGLAPGGTLQGSDTVSVAGTTSWTAGVMTGSGVTNANGGVALSGFGPRDLGGTRRLNTAGSSAWTGNGATRLATAAVIHNTGTWDAQTDLTMSRINISGGLFENAAGGIFRKTAGAGTTAFQFPFTNAGSVRGQIGTLSFDAGFVQTAGSITAQGGTIGSSAPLDIQGGVVGGTSTFSVGVVDAGHLARGLSPGSVTITGALTQTSGAAFDVELGGTTPGTTHDRAVVTGAATLAGALNVALVNGFLPADHDLFTIMTFASSTGEFGTMNLPPLAGDLNWKYHHNPTSIILEALIDLDGDGVSNAIDCAPNDATAWSLPAEVAGVGFAADGQTLSWGSLAAQAGPAIVYDVMRGQVGQWPVGSGAAETCLVSDTAATQITDSTTPAVGAALYYLTRGANVCGIGTYGNRSNGTPRVTPICP